MFAELNRVLYRDVDKSLFFESSAIERSLNVYLEGVFDGIPYSDNGQILKHSFFVPTEIRLRLKESIGTWERTTKRLSQSTLMVRLVGLDGKIMRVNLNGWERQVIFPDFERDSVFMEAGESLQVIHFRGKPLRLHYRLIRRDGRPLYIIQLGTSIDDVRNTLNRLRLIILLSIPGAVLAACIAGWFLVKRSFNPVDMMIREAHKITAAYMKSRLPRTNTGDELDRLAETLNAMIDRIESSTRAVQDFSYDVSHELKTPLAIIRGEIDVALRRSRTSEELVQTLKTIGGEVNELIRLVDDLMLLVRSDSKQLRFDMKPVVLSDVLQQVGSRYQERAKGKSIHFSVQVLNDAKIKGDDIYLKRLLSNLLDNAIKFTPENGRVWMSLKKADEKAVIEVGDTGMGIDSAVQSKVFARFYRAEPARSHEGAGLGLNIAKAITDVHGGSITLTSVPSKGTVVSIALPILP